MFPLFMLFTLVLRGSGFLQDDWAVFENDLRPREISKTDATPIGCFKDNWDRAIPDPLANKSSDMILQMCFDRCSSRGKSYFAVHSGDSCSCGNEDAAYDKYGVGTGCDTPCSGNNEEKCGGTWRNSVYKIHRAGEHIGCYTNALSQTSHFYSDKMTVKMCYDVCKVRKTSYFALQDAAWCYCGGEEATVNKWINAPNGCNIDCAGDVSQKCGGLEHNSVYKIPVQAEYGYTGCYYDTADKALPDPAPFSLSTMTIKKCYDSCKSRGKRYFGLQYGHICFCADANAAYDQYGPGTECNVPCSGNVTEVCGGPWTNSVYEIYKST